MLDSHAFAGHLKTLFDGVTVTGLATGTAKVFEWFDKMLNDKARLALSRWLKNLPRDPDLESWTLVFPKLIDRVFGPDALSLSFIFRSCIASVFAVTAVTLIWIRSSLGPRHVDRDTLVAYLSGVLFELILAFVVNFVPDYCSLLISRLIVRRMAKTSSVVATIILLLLDTISTAFLAFFFTSAAYMMALFLMGGVSGGDSEQTTILDILNFRRPHPIGQYALPLFYSSFFTSIWVWLYVIAGLSVKTLRSMSFVWARIRPWLDIDQKPMIALGRVAGSLVAATYALILAIHKLLL